MKRRLEEFLHLYTLEVEDIGLEHHDLKESLRDSSGSMPVLGCIPQRLGAQGYDVFSITQRGMGKAKPALNCANSKLPESCPAGGCQVVVGGKNLRLDHDHAQQGYKTSEDDVWNKMQLLIWSIIAHSS